MFEKFTERARRVVILAQEEAKRLNHRSVGVEHMLLAIVREHEGVACKVLEFLSIDLSLVKAEVENAIGKGDRTEVDEVSFTLRAKKSMELALDEAHRLGHNYIGTEHLLLGLIREGEGVAARVLEAMGADLERVRFQVVVILGQKRSPESVTTVPLTSLRLGSLDWFTDQDAVLTELYENILRVKAQIPQSHLLPFWPLQCAVHSARRELFMLGRRMFGLINYFPDRHLLPEKPPDDD